MKKVFKVFLLLLFFLIQAQFVFSQDEEASDSKSQPARGAKEIVIHGLIGTAETLFVNGALVFYNTVLKQEPWAGGTLQSIKRNFTSPWKWEETDGFKVNQVGHPIQGSLYYNAGRVNGFSFYESAFFSALGSFTWEAFGERSGASVNDFITTTSVSMSLGEMLFRLYKEVRASGVPAIFPFFFNPIAGLHYLIAGYDPKDSGGNIYQFQAFLGMSWTATDTWLPNENRSIYSLGSLVGDIGFSVIYGNPFEQESRTPYEHFEFSMSLGINANYMGVRFLSDSYLFSFSPVFTDTDMMSTGLSLHYDFASLGKYSLYEGNVDQSANALDWTVKYQRLFSNGAVLQEKLHAGFTFFGVSDYYLPETSKKNMKNYGYGYNIKEFFSLEHKIPGKLEIGILYYNLLPYPGTSAISYAFVNWLFVDLTYSRYITKHLSLGISDFFSAEWGFYMKSGFPDTKSVNNAVKFYLAWNYR